MGMSRGWAEDCIYKVLKSVLLGIHAAALQRKEMTECALEVLKMDFKKMGFELGCKG